MTATTKPEVVYLPAIFKSIRSGRIRIPAFQRGFVWKPKQVIELLESVYKSYPIGSLLFWEVDAAEMRTDSGPEVPLPHPDVAGVVDFVLDGMQRVSSLYGAFHAWSRSPEKDPFALVFDLRDRHFLHHSERTESSVSLRVLFSPKELLQEQARLNDLPSGEDLIDASINLQNIFQQFIVI